MLLVPFEQVLVARHDDVGGVFTRQGLAVGLLQEVGVDVECGGGAAMAESAGDGPDVDAGADELRRDEVAKVVEAADRRRGGPSAPTTTPDVA